MYEAKNFNHLIGTEGFSDSLLKNHFTLYQGYVTNTNKVADKLESADQSSPEYAELKRRFGWEFNGMRLHELYFGNLVKNGSRLDTGSELSKKIESSFGSYENWEKDFRSAGAMRGVGWVILCHDKETDRLFNVWVNEHDVGHLSGGTPLLVMDVFEHAFITDYGLKRADYINAFISAIDWQAVSDRM